MSSPFRNDESLRFLDKSRNANERNNYDGWWKEQLRMYGTEVEYFTSSYSLSGHDNVYGESPTERYGDGKRLIMAINLNENAIAMKEFGLIADDEITGFVHIKSYSEVFGLNTEPKSGDVFNLIEFGNDRPGGRGGKHFEITERIDQDVNQINPILGHYVWLVKAKRHDYSFEPGLQPENVSDQVDDGNIDEQSQSIFDYNTNTGSNDDVYGDYV
jgi:hypothetical protein